MANFSSKLVIASLIFISFCKASAQNNDTLFRFNPPLNKKSDYYLKDLNVKQKNIRISVDSTFKKIHVEISKRGKIKVAGYYLLDTIIVRTYFIFDAADVSNRRKVVDGLSFLYNKEGYWKKYKGKKTSQHFYIKGKEIL